MNRKRPVGITALALFFSFGALISFTSAVSLLCRGGPLEAMWRINPRALDAFSTMGAWAIVLLGAVCVACGTAAVGLWRDRRWGRRVGLTILVINLVADLANATVGHDPRAVIGVPIAALLALYLWRSERAAIMAGKATDRGA